MRIIVTDHPGQHRVPMRPQPPKGMVVHDAMITIDASPAFLWSGNGRAWGIIAPSFRKKPRGFLPWHVEMSRPELTDGVWFWVYEVKP